MRLLFLPAQPFNVSDTAAVARCQGMLAAAMIVLDAARLAALLLLAQHVQYRQKPTSPLLVLLTPYGATSLADL